MSVAGVARDLAARLGVPFALPDARRSPSTAGDAAGGVVGRDRRPRPVRPLPVPGARRRHGRAVAAVAGRAGSRWPGHAARSTTWSTSSNYVMLELGQPNHTYDLDQARRAGACGSAGPATARRIVTLDDVERTLDRGDDGVIADGDDVAVGIAGVMGGAVDRDLRRRPPSVLLEMAWWRPHGDRPHRRSASGLRSEASARFERGTDPEVVDLAAAALRRAARRRRRRAWPPGAVDERGDLPDRGAGAGPHRAGQRPARHRARRRPTIAELLEPIGFDVDRRSTATDVLDVTVPDLPARHRHRDRRHRGGRPPPRLQPHRPHACPAVAHAGGLTPASTTGARSARSLVGLGLDEAMPLPFLAPGDLERRRARPARPSPSPTRSPPRSRCCARRCCPGCSRPSPTTPPTATRASRLFEIGKVFRRPPPGGQPCPTSASTRRGAGRRDAAGGGRGLAVAGRGARRADGARSSRPPCAGLHPTRSADWSRVGGRGRRRGRRGRPDGARPPRRRRAGGLARGRPRPRCSALPHGDQRRTARSAGSRRATSTWPSRSTTTSRPAPSRPALRAAGGDLLVEVAPVRRVPGRAGAATGAAAWPTACASRPRPHPHRRRGRRGPRPPSSPPSSRPTAPRLRGLIPTLA